MKAYKIELLVIDFDELGEELIRQEIENVRYPNDCLTPQVKKISCRDIGEWDDNHPLNKRTTADQTYKNIFDN